MAQEPALMADAPADIESVGILGAGRVGKALAALARDAGLAVEIAGSGGGADAVVACDAVVLAIPLSKYRTLPREALGGSLVIDAMNYWWELDGKLAEFEDPHAGSSEVVSLWLEGARVVKALNHLSAYALENLATARGSRERLAVAVAGDRREDIDAVGALVDQMGFDPVVAGPLAEGVKFEPGTELFGADADAEEAREMLERFWDSQRGRVLSRRRR